MLQLSAWGNERDNRNFRVDFAVFQKELFFNGRLGARQCPASACGPLVCDVAVNQGQGVPGDLPDEFLELFVGSVPLFDLRDQIHRHIDGARLGLLFEGQMPAWGGAAGPLEGAE